MLTVTDSALANLSNALDKIEQQKPENACFRIVPNADGKLGLTLDVPLPEDNTFEHEGATVLIASEEICEHCEGRTLDSDDEGNLVIS